MHVGLYVGSGPLSKGEASEVRDPPLADLIGADE